MTTESIDITIRVPVNASNQAIAAALRMRAGLFEGLSAKAAASRKNTDSAPIETSAEESSEFTEDASDSAKAEQEEFDLSGASEDESEQANDADFTTPPAAKNKTAKAKKVTIEQVNAACKERAKAGGKDGRKQVLALLKKHFKSESITDIKPELYGKIIQVMEA